MTLEKISVQNIDPSRSCIKAVFCVRNEKFRLPFFLDYYRKLGVREFFAIDNFSDDNTQKYLLQQKDVHVFFTKQEYKKSNAGRDWTHELASKYCIDNWCLTLDVDEFFLYQESENVDLNILTKYLDNYGYQGVFSIFLDFYSDKKLSETCYEEGQSPFSICEFFDSPSSYTCYSREIFPYFEVKGGVRQRVFWKGEDNKVGPSMRKLVLVKWTKGFAYTHSTHSCTPLKLADITGAVAHFKFLSHFADYAKSEVARNGRIANSIDWRVYADRLSGEDVSFYSEETSIKYVGISSLVEAGLIRVSAPFADYISQSTKETQRLSRSVLKSCEGAEVSYEKLINLWGGISLGSKSFSEESVASNTLVRFEKDMLDAANSSLWKASFPFRKLASRFGLTDQRSLTEENFYNQSLHARFTFTYKSIWWDILGPFRVIQKVIRRVRRKSN